MTPEHERAKAWRKKHGWTLDQLSELTGWSVSAIIWFERGAMPPDKREGSDKPRPMNAYSWARYRRTCHSVAVETRTKKPFDWGA